MAVSRIRDALLDVLFPCVRCMACGSAQNVKDGLCAQCREEMERYPLTASGARAVYIYEGAARELIHRMKFSGEYELPVRLFADEMEKTLEALKWDVDCVTAVPAAPETLRKRGYNQAEKLAKRLCRSMGLRFERQVLRKKRGTRSQVGLDASGRRRNLMGAVLPGRRSETVRGKRVLLIDDVYTTGATAEACSRVLRACGAEEIYVLCAARVADHALEEYLAGKTE